MINESNYKLYAKTVYDNPFCLSVKEFESDLRRISLLKRILTEYEQGRIYNIRMITNMFITIFNVFKHEGAVNLIKFKLDKVQYRLANTFMLFLNLPLLKKRSYDKQILNKLNKEFYNN